MINPIPLHKDNQLPKTNAGWTDQLGEAMAHETAISLRMDANEAKPDAELTAAINQNKDALDALEHRRKRLVAEHQESMDAMQAAFERKFEAHEERMAQLMAAMENLQSAINAAGDEYNQAIDRIQAGHDRDMAALDKKRGAHEAFLAACAGEVN